MVTPDDPPRWDYRREPMPLGVVVTVLLVVTAWVLGAVVGFLLCLVLR